MFYCAHDPGLALLLAGDQGRHDQTAPPPAFIRLIMIAILAVNASALTVIALA